MTINNREAYLDSIWDWGVFDGCFGGKIRITDIDGAIERRGNTLILETKGFGVKTNTGQTIMFNSWRATGRFTILIVWGDPGKPIAFQIQGRDYVSPVMSCDIEKLTKLVSEWYKQANSGLGIDEEVLVNGLS